MNPASVYWGPNLFFQEVLGKPATQFFKHCHFSPIFQVPVPGTGTWKINSIIYVLKIWL